MTCPSCQKDNTAAALVCETCGQTLPGIVVFGRYELESHLGSGGMGTVFKAHDRSLDVTVAVKTVPAGDPERASRFKSEVRLARSVHHKNVCVIHDIGEDGDRGLLFITMQHIEGRDLKQILREKTLTWEDAYEITLQIAEGLQAIHDAGVIHRDLKAANVMRDSHGLVKVLDFGIAKAWGDQSLSSYTQTGKVVGTADYMSPEQAQGGTLDFRSDLYSFGVLIFEIFTGRVPFRGDSPVAVMYKHVQEPPPLDGPASSQLPGDLVPVLRKALAKNPHERYATCGEMTAALRHAQAGLQDRSTEPVPSSPPADSEISTANGPTLLVVGVKVPEAPPSSTPATSARLPGRLLVAGLIAGLKHPDKAVRATAAQRLGTIGPEAVEAIRHLLEALRDPAPEVRAEAERALALIGANAALPGPPEVETSSAPPPTSSGESPPPPPEVESPPPPPPPPVAAPGPQQDQDIARSAETPQAAEPTPAPPLPEPAAEPAPKPVVKRPAPNAPQPHKDLPPAPRAPRHLPRHLLSVVMVVALAALVSWGVVRLRGDRPPQDAPLASPTPLPPSPSLDVEPSTTTTPPEAPEVIPAPTLLSKLPTSKTERLRPSPSHPAVTVPTPVPSPPVVTPPEPTPSPTPPPPVTTLPAPPASPAPAIPAASAAVKPGDLVPLDDRVAAPVCIKCPTPAYPDIALRAKVEGRVTLRALVDENGNVIAIESPTGPNLLRDAAVRGVRMWKYAPATSDGVPVKVWNPVTLQFKMPD